MDAREVLEEPPFMVVCSCETCFCAAANWSDSRLRAAALRVEVLLELLELLLLDVEITLPVFRSVLTPLALTLVLAILLDYT